MISSCEITSRTSKKGVEYLTLDITLKNGYKKVVFLDNAEQYMLRALVDKQNNNERR